MKTKWILVLFFLLYGSLAVSANVSAYGDARALVVGRGDYIDPGNSFL